MIYEFKGGLRWGGKFISCVLFNLAESWDLEESGGVDDHGI